MSKTGKTQGQALTPEDYEELRTLTHNLSDMFQQVAKPKMFWWSITVPEDVTASGGIDVSLYRWAELLRSDYKAELCNLGGVGNKDRSQWILYAVTGEGVTPEHYQRVADVCASAVKALGIFIMPRFKPTVLERLDIAGDFKCFKSVIPARYKKFADWRDSVFKSLWIVERPTARLSVLEYLNAFAENGDNPLPVSGSATTESYWILNWFEFLFGAAHEAGCLIRVHSGSQYSTGWEVAEIPFRRIDHDVSEASILALKFLRMKVETRMQALSKVAAETERQTTKKKTAKAKKPERKYKPWNNPGDACFIIVYTTEGDWTKGIHFHHDGKHKNLWLASGSRTETLLTQLKGQYLAPEVIKGGIGKGKTKGSDVVTYANGLLNDKIRRAGCTGLPEYDVAFVMLQVGRYECVIPIYTKDEFDRIEIEELPDRQR